MFYGLRWDLRLSGGCLEGEVWNCERKREEEEEEEREGGCGGVVSLFL